MSTRILQAVLAASLVLSLVPTSLAIAKAPTQPPDYRRDVRQLPNGSTFVFEGWSEPVSRSRKSAPSPVVDPGGGGGCSRTYKTMIRRYAAFNSGGQLVLEYQLSQTFGYDCVSIFYKAAPTHTHVATYGWSLVSHDESDWWVDRPIHRRTHGEYWFRREILTPEGNIWLNEFSCWLGMDYHANGLWQGSNC